jgi:hypothetical protein
MKPVQLIKKKMLLGQMLPKNPQVLKSRLSREQRLGLSRKIISARKFDRRGYETLLFFNLPKRVEKMFAQRKRPISLLDIGSGNNIAMAELANQVGSKVNITTIGLTRPKSGLQNIKPRIGAFENKILGKKFDLIVSAAGTPYLAIQPFVIQKIVNLLARGGEARISYDIHESQLINKIEKELKNQGFEVDSDGAEYAEESPDAWYAAALIIKRTHSRPAKLESLIREELKNPIKDNTQQVWDNLTGF